jgi:hypothetical protein
MEKNLLKSLLVGMLICCLTVVIATSCANDDLPVSHNEETTDQLLGDWLYFNSDDDEEMVGQSVSYSLLRFDENGVITRTIYSGYEGTPLENWERWRRHGIYTVDEAAHTITIDDIDNSSQVTGYNLVDGQLILEFTSDNGNTTQTSILRRPQAADLELLEQIDKAVPSDDYIGKWVRTETENGQTTYVLADYQELFNIVVNRYTVTSDNKVFKSNETINYTDRSWDDEDGFLVIYENGIYEEGIKHWWKVEGSSLSIGYENSEEPRYTYHQLTKEEYEMFQAFEKSAIISNLAERIIGKWEVYEVNGEVAITNSIQVLTYDADGTVHYTPSVSAMMDLGIWSHHLKGAYTINGNVSAQQVTFENILFTQQMNVQDINENHLYATTNTETFVDGKSHRVTEGLKEYKVKVTEDFSEYLIGLWEGCYIDQELNSDKDVSCRLAFKADGTFEFYRQNDQNEWVAGISMGEYFTDGEMLYMRWKNVGDDKMRYDSWVYTASEGYLAGAAKRQDEKGEIHASDLFMKSVIENNP